MQRTVAGGLARDCDPARNHAAQLYNSRLKEEVARLREELHCQRIGYVDIYDVLQDMIDNPCKYGAHHSSPVSAALPHRVLCKLTPVLRMTCGYDGCVAGFDVSTRGCCGTGDFEVTLLCNQVTAATCPDDRKYVFWDSFHPTERAYEIIVDHLFPRYIENLL